MCSECVLYWCGRMQMGHGTLQSKKATAAQIFLDTFPQLVGTKFGDLVFRFSDGLVLGLLNRRSGACDIAPPADTLVSPSSPATGCAWRAEAKL